MLCKFGQKKVYKLFTEENWDDELMRMLILIFCFSGCTELQVGNI